MSSNSVVYWGTGRRKTSVARVRLVPGNGTITINGRPGDNYLNYNPAYIAAVKAPLETLGLGTEYDILVNVTVADSPASREPSSKVPPVLSVNCPPTTASPSRPKATSAATPSQGTPQVRSQESS